MKSKYHTFLAVQDEQQNWFRFSLWLTTFLTSLHFRSQFGLSFPSGTPTTFLTTCFYAALFIAMLIQPTLSPRGINRYQQQRYSLYMSAIAFLQYPFVTTAAARTHLGVFIAFFAELRLFEGFACGLALSSGGALIMKQYPCLLQSYGAVYITSLISGFSCGQIVTHYLDAGAPGNGHRIAGFCLLAAAFYCASQLTTLLAKLPDFETFRPRRLPAGIEDAEIYSEEGFNGIEDAEIYSEEGDSELSEEDGSQGSGASTEYDFSDFDVSERLLRPTEEAIVAEPVSKCSEIVKLGTISWRILFNTFAVILGIVSLYLIWVAKSVFDERSDFALSAHWGNLIALMSFTVQLFVTCLPEEVDRRWIILAGICILPAAFFLLGPFTLGKTIFDIPVSPMLLYSGILLAALATTLIWVPSILEISNATNVFFIETNSHHDYSAFW
eukprot:CAMPEP_0115036052 /NCGR_PEP_ID=MMETSP0216-20121206/41855_1 /TAXON_ID=223996 /ORGANISM="Protocruzia adherens, Strain Boccale" /LENGTH=440 /DNA_ID=CAMNT_0002415731 /DNA_START=281 /DNA_END=1601 /DNA_ORIENTATION=+